MLPGSGQWRRIRRGESPVRGQLISWELGREGITNIERAVGVVHATADDLAITHKNAANRRLIVVQGVFGLGQSALVLVSTSVVKLTWARASRMKCSCLARTAGSICS